MDEPSEESHINPIREHPYKTVLGIAAYPLTIGAVCAARYLFELAELDPYIWEIGRFRIGRVDIPIKTYPVLEAAVLIGSVIRSLLTLNTVIPEMEDERDEEEDNFPNFDDGFLCHKGMDET